MNVVIVEDHPMMRSPIAVAVVAERGRVVGSTGSGAEAIALIERLRPDIAVIDLQLLDLDGFTVAESVLPLVPRLRILVMSASINDHKLLRMEQLGLPGFIHKQYAETLAMRKALSELHAGRVFYCPHFREFRDQLKTNSMASSKRLTPAEIRVLGGIGCGETNEQIAAELGTALTTIVKHRSNLLKKLNLSASPQLVHYAIEHGFTEASYLNLAARPAQNARVDRVPGTRL